MNETIIKDRIKDFTWYTPVDFGNGIIAEGDFKLKTSLDSIHFGIQKWKYIIERNLPDLQGKRVMDVGCNNGISCINMSRLGASEVIGIDSDKTWTNWKNQAEFVKEALEWRCNTKYNIDFIESNMAKIPDLDLGHFDVVTALCCIYYLSEGEMQNLVNYLREHVDYLLIQCNTQDQTPDIHYRAVPSYIMKVLKKAGYPHVSLDKPLLYERPVVVGSVKPIRKLENVQRRDILRDWIRRKI